MIMSSLKIGEERGYVIGMTFAVLCPELDYDEYILECTTADSLGRKSPPFSKIIPSIKDWDSFEKGVLQGFIAAWNREKAPTDNLIEFSYRSRRKKTKLRRLQLRKTFEHRG